MGKQLPRSSEKQYQRLGSVMHFHMRLTWKAAVIGDSIGGKSYQKKYKKPCCFLDGTRIYGTHNPINKFALLIMHAGGQYTFLCYYLEL
mmetsp:Transcript_11919/g.15051  ORF Transcript_11919/g.15051 Transcript_11919/m.15051 type:complete len:89 (+) Transcript_11919:1364-1630(+)